MAKTNSVRFEGQLGDENVVALFRRHLLSLWKEFILLLISLAIIVLSIIFLSNAAVYIVGVSILLTIFCVAKAVIKWYYSFYVLTDYRLRYFGQRGFFSSSLVDIKLGEIDGVVCVTKGLFASLFRYGDIVISSRSGELIMPMISNVEIAYNLIQQHIK